MIRLYSELMRNGVVMKVRPDRYMHMYHIEFERNAKTVRFVFTEEGFFENLKSTEDYLIRMLEEFVDSNRLDRMWPDDSSRDGNDNYWLDDDEDEVASRVGLYRHD